MGQDNRSPHEENKKEHRHVVGEVIDKLDHQVEGTIVGVDRMMRPIRRSAFRRFPTFFTLLATFGAVATFLGIEKILEQYEVLTRYPWLMLAIGVGILVVTGRLYKKLG